MKFVFQRDRTISSVFGHSIFFPKGVPTHVPPAMHREVLAVGGLPEGELDLDAPAPAPGVTEPVTPDAREAALFAAFKAMALRNKREEFTAGGLPHLKALSKELGWEFTNSKERDQAWVKFKTTPDA